MSAVRWVGWRWNISVGGVFSHSVAGPRLWIRVGAPQRASTDISLDFGI